MPDSPDLPGPTDIIAESQLSKELLFGIFQAAYLKPEIDCEGELWVHGRSGIPYIVGIDSYITFYVCSFFRKDLDRNERLESLNDMNSTSGIARFSMSEEGIPLDVGCYLPVEEGLTPLQLLNFLTIFDTEVINALEWMKDSLDPDGPEVE